MSRILSLLTVALVAIVPALADWVAVDYASIVDRRVPSHSGESVGDLLDALAGTPDPGLGGDPDVRMRHSLLEPLLERYAYLLPDALDARGGVDAAAWVEVAQLWPAGAAQPAWVELLRSRRYLVESDGAGRLRAFLPMQASADPVLAPDPALDSLAAARRAWDRERPWLRLVVAAEGRRLGASTPLSIEIYPYTHLLAQTRLVLGDTPHRPQLDDLRSDGLRRPLDLDGWRTLVESGWRVEGARIDPDGELRLLGSPAAERPTLLGSPVTLADVAVAYRAVFKGGISEPYMSLDRGYAPQTAVVNYGGRLRDSAIGWVSLLCDIRFKTFSLGVDIVSGDDVRDRLRRSVPEFATHLERFARHPDSSGSGGQQTRLWFYPDRVDLTLSPQNDVLVLRRVRMTAASERVALGGTAAGGEDPPWTRATVAAINRDYDALAAAFPELEDLDEVVRWLSLFTWLRELDRDGWALPDLDLLLGVELPSIPTPRTYPQLLGFNALPEQGQRGEIEVIERVEITEALDRLGPVDGTPLDARRRFERAVAALDPNHGPSKAFLDGLAATESSALDASALDLLSFRAERLRMHQTVLGTLPVSERRRLVARQQREPGLRIFSVGIGGLDLGMGAVLDRARRGSAAGGETTRPTPPSAPVAAWRVDAPFDTVLPPQSRVRVEARDGAKVTLAWGASADAARREARFGADRKLTAIERYDDSRRLAYAFEGAGAALRVVERPTPTAPLWTLPPAGEATTLPGGLGAIRVGNSDKQGALRVRLTGESGRSIEADFPRPVLQRLVLGRRADRAAESALPGFSPLPANLGSPGTLMLFGQPGLWLAPWRDEATRLAGEEDPRALARALGEWWRFDALDHRAVVGVDPTASPARWESAPRPSAARLLIADGPPARMLERLRAEWPAGELPERFDEALVVYVTAAGDAEAARDLEALAADPRMRGKLLAVWPLQARLRPELPARLLESGLAGVGIAEPRLTALRDAASDLVGMREALASGLRVEAVADPFLWHF